MSNKFMNNADVIKFFKDQFEENPEFKAFIERFGEAFVKPAIKLVQEGKDAEAKKHLEAGGMELDRIYEDLCLQCETAIRDLLKELAHE